jgi:hypothetical protein
MPEGFTPAPPSAYSPVQLATDRSRHLDPSAVLPPAAARKLRAIEQKVEDAHVLIPSFEMRQEVNVERLTAQQRLDYLLRPLNRGGGGLGDEDDSRLVQARANLARATAEAERLDELYRSRSGAWQRASQVLTAIREWLKNGRPSGVTLVDHVIETPQLRKGETINDAIARLQRRGRELLADAHRIRSSPYPSSHVKAQIRAQIDELAERGRPIVSEAIEHDRAVVFATHNVRSTIIGADQRSLGFAETADALALVVWVNREALIAKLDALVDEESSDDEAMSHEQRGEAEAQVRADLLQIEREECALTEQAGLDYRPEADVRAILAIEAIATPFSLAGGGTSPAHAIDIIGG